MGSTIAFSSRLRQPLKERKIISSSRPAVEGKRISIKIIIFGVELLINRVNLI